MSTLYLTTAERALYDKLPAALKKAWDGDVAEEKGTAWETDDELRERMITFAEDTSSPELKEMVKTIKAKIEHKEDLDSWSPGDIPESLLSTLFFVMGARGLSQMIAGALQGPEIILETIAAFSGVRHSLLETNNKYTYA